MRTQPNPRRSVLIFGGAGFIGSNLAAYLLENSEAKLHIFDNLSRPGVAHNLRWLEQKAKGSSRLQFTRGDVRDRELVVKAVNGVTEIFHLAAQVAVTTSIADPRHDFETNLLGTFNILEAARASESRPFLLFTSTNKVYGDFTGMNLSRSALRYSFEGIPGINEQQPLSFHSPYGCSKGAADQYVLDYARIYGIPAVVFRMSCIAGPRQFGNEDQGWVAHFLYSALENHPLTIYGDGRQVRDVLHVADLVRAFESARLNLPNTAGNVYNVGGGEVNAVSLLEVINAVECLTGKRIQYTHAPARRGDQLIYVTDFQKLARHTGWRPQIQVSGILRDILAWRKEHDRLFSPAKIIEFGNALGAVQQPAA